MNVIGIDIAKDFIIDVAMTSRPADPRQFYRTCSFLKLEPNEKDIARLLALKPDVAVMEPTGINYLKIWESKLEAAGVEIKFVGHRELRHYRGSTLQLPDKDDLADAIALGCYYFDSHQFGLRFVPRRDPTIVQLREWVLRLGHLARVQNPIINRLRQDLAWQFPETANKTLDATLFWAWLAGEKPSTQYDGALAQSCGSGLTSRTREQAAMLLDIHRQEKAIETRISQLMGDERFVPYRKVLARFGFGRRVEAMLLSEIFPVEMFLAPMGDRKSNTIARANLGNGSRLG